MLPSNSVAESDSRGLTFGRYDICTTAHVHTMEVIAKHFGGIAIGVIEDGIRQNDAYQQPRVVAEFYSLADAQHQKTTLNLRERLQMVRLSLADAGLAVDSEVSPILRPEYAVSAFNAKFPQDKFQLTFPMPTEGQAMGFDSVRDMALPIILGRTVTHVPTTFTLHCSDIKHVSVAQPDVWRQYMTPATYDFFVSIDGPNRVTQKVNP